MPTRTRCAWAGDDPAMIAYHDEEWGRPSHDDRHLFEMLTLEGAQAGLSWRTILRKREAYRAAFARFDPEKVARFGARDVARLLGDEGIVRNRLKVESTLTNARAFLRAQRELGSFDALVWSFVGGRALVRRPRTMGEVPATSPESDAMSKALRARGFRFVGSTICYAFMQACGLVDDHAATCFRSGAKKKITVTDGPFTETKEVIGGWAILEAASKAEAIRIATEFMELHRKHWPDFEGESEVRPMFDHGMGP